MPPGVYARNKEATYGEINCKFCDSTFTKPERASKYCSDECRRSALARQLQEGFARWRERNPDGLRRRNLKLMYGISLEEYAELLLLQGGGCAICGKSPGKRPLDVDHCHESGAVRGLLCLNCNAGLGQFKDDTRSVAKALEYLLR